MKNFYCIFILLLLLAAPCPGHSKETTEQNSPFKRLAGLGRHIDCFDARINVLGFGRWLDLQESDLNPENSLEIPGYESQLLGRPDFYLMVKNLELGLKPRAAFRWEKINDGRSSGQSATDSEFYVNEWMARLRMGNSVFLSYGRENLQWGPSYLLCPSNPFNMENGRNNPFLEVPGMDYAKAVWIPSNSWTMSFIANLGKGRQEDPEFKKTFALKIDYVGENKYASLIPSVTQDGDEDPAIGAFAGWTVSDSTIVYAEANASSEKQRISVLVGGAYTFAGGSNLAIEYYRNGNGCAKSPFLECLLPEEGLTPPELAAQEQGGLDQLEGITGGVQWEAPGPNARDLAGLGPFSRKNYLMVQYTKTRIKDRLNVTLRAIAGLDDSSMRLISIFQYDANDFLQPFVVADAYLGESDTEIAGLLQWSVMAGLSFTMSLTE